MKWVVYIEDEVGSAYVHDTQESAERDARQWAEDIKRDVYVTELPGARLRFRPVQREEIQCNCSAG